MTRTRIVIGGGAIAVLAIVAVTAGVYWYTSSRGDAPSEVSLSEAVATVSDGAGMATDASEADALVGTWVIAADGASFVGYRVREELVGVGAFTAVGRTANVTGTLTFDGDAITAVNVQADLTTLQSNDSRRDGQLRRQALETDRYPTATFELTQPIDLGTVPDEGVPVKTMAVGNLTLHGVTRPVSIELHGQRTNGLVVVVGSLEIAFADYGMTPPAAPVVLSVEDRGVMELQLVFQKPDQG